MAIPNNMVPPMPTLNLLSPIFCAIPDPPSSCLLEPFAIVPLWSNLDKAKVAAEKLQYHHDHIALPLFSEQNPDHLQMPMGENIQMEGIKLYVARRL